MVFTDCIDIEKVEITFFCSEVHFTKERDPVATFIAHYPLIPVGIILKKIQEAAMSLAIGENCDLIPWHVEQPDHRIGPFEMFRFKNSNIHRREYIPGFLCLLCAGFSFLTMQEQRWQIYLCL